tara:strand:+ start:1058 stop:1348 length:291 start_codon:yes stop_codon:yes gene_type:complete
MTQVAVIHTAFEDTPRTVAFVEVGERVGTDALEYAYRWTQNLMDSWSLKMPQDSNDDVTVVGEIVDGMGIRSTSMGDQMLLGNTKYKVAMCGFEKI